MPTKRQREIAAKIADGCLRAINQGWQITPQSARPYSDCAICPLGSYLVTGPSKGQYMGHRFPGVIPIMSDPECLEFIRAFDDGIIRRTWASKLGLAYRAWSQKKYGWE